jgi:hypothetical protein
MKMVPYPNGRNKKMVVHNYDSDDDIVEDDDSCLSSMTGYTTIRAGNPGGVWCMVALMKKMIVAKIL